MSKIMRQLEAEARASRKAAEAPAEVEQWVKVSPDILLPENAVCIHGLMMKQTCYACARVGEPVQLDFDFDI